jgi:Protein of unknown function (DUF3592)
MLTSTQLLWTAIAAGFFLLLFAGGLHGLVRLRRQLAAAKGWIKIEGEIVASEVKLWGSHTSDDDSDAGVVIHYRYRVGGRDLEGSRIQIGGGELALTRRDAERLVGKYPVGARVEVYYDPHKPEDAALEPQRRDNVATQIVFTLVFGAIGGLLAAHAIAGKMLVTANGLPVFAFVLPVAFLSIGIALAVASVRMRREAKASMQWPTTIGHIKNSAVVEEISEDRDDDGRTRTSTHYRADIAFACRVGARDYVATTWKWGMERLYGSPAGAQKVIARYPQGQQVTVHYDPAQPDTAVLEPENRQGTVAPFVISGVFATAGVFMLILFVSVPWTRAGGY